MRGGGGKRKAGREGKQKEERGSSLSSLYIEIGSMGGKQLN